ncbi:hypothetical protein B0H19DRAFT_957395 [Mycena capillaripes]|nr:hypothetical protein B0H19DRAFT_957395 [Mycena capillaripes]
MNPLVQGWSAVHFGSHAVPNWGTQPSISVVTFTFTSFGATILNSILVGSDNRTYFHITTDASSPRCTVVEDASRGRVGLISWESQPTITIDDLGWTMRTSQWLYLSSNRACRTMIAHGEQFSWRPNGGCIELFSIDGHSDSQAFARISQGPSGTVLQLTPRAIQKRLLKVVTIAAVLLMSGQRID